MAGAGCLRLGKIVEELLGPVPFADQLQRQTGQAKFVQRSPAITDYVIEGTPTSRSPLRNPAILTISLPSPSAFPGEIGYRTYVAVLGWFPARTPTAVGACGHRSIFRWATRPKLAFVQTITDWMFGTACRHSFRARIA